MTTLPAIEPALPGLDLAGLNAGPQAPHASSLDDATSQHLIVTDWPLEGEPCLAAVGERTNRRFQASDGRNIGLVAACGSVIAHAAALTFLAVSLQWRPLPVPIADDVTIVFELRPPESQSAKEDSRSLSEEGESAKPLPSVESPVPQEFEERIPPAHNRAESLTEDDRQSPDPAKTAGAEGTSVSEEVSSPASDMPVEGVETQVTANVEEHKDAIPESADPVDSSKPEPVEGAQLRSEAETQPREKPIARKIPSQRTRGEDKSEPRNKPKAAKARDGKSASKATAKPDKSNDSSSQRSSSDPSVGGSEKAGSDQSAVANYPGLIHRRLQRAARSSGSGLKGVATVAFTVAASGEARSVRLAKTSGKTQLDRAAISAVHRASPFPPIPPEAQRSSWSFEVPVVFGDR